MKNVAINIRRNNRQNCSNKVLITRALQSLYFRQKNGTIGAVNWQLLANCLALLLFCHSIAYTLKPWITASLNNVRVKGQKMGIHHTSPNSSNISLLLHSKVCWTWRLNIEKKFGNGSDLFRQWATLSTVGDGRINLNDSLTKRDLKWPQDNKAAVDERRLEHQWTRRNSRVSATPKWLLMERQRTVGDRRAGRGQKGLARREEEAPDWVQGSNEKQTDGVSVTALSSSRRRFRPEISFARSVCRCQLAAPTDRWRPLDR